MRKAFPDRSFVPKQASGEEEAQQKKGPTDGKRVMKPKAKAKGAAKAKVEKASPKSKGKKK